METTTRTPQDYAKNYPTVSRNTLDVIFGPISVGNVVPVSNSKGERLLINLCLKLEGDDRSNLVYDVPQSWNLDQKFKTGDRVDVELRATEKDGKTYINVYKITPAKVISIKKVSVVNTVNEAVAQANADKKLEDQLAQQFEEQQSNGHVVAETEEAF